MKYNSLALVSLIALAMTSRGFTAEPDRPDVLDRIDSHIKPLTSPLGDRLPILTWQSRGFPTGLEDGRVEEVQQLLLDRGIAPLSNPLNNTATALEYLPLLEYRQSRGCPICILPQGWLQTYFVPARDGRYKAAHQAPAEESEEFPCPAQLQDERKLTGAAARTTEVLSLLKERGIDVDLLVVDFESGAYLRNTGDSDEEVRRQASMAAKCPRCVETFGVESLDTPVGYAAVVDRARALGTRSMLCDPARAVFPEIRVGNYYAWPVNRVSRPDGRWPAYGYEQSGMDVAMPRVYMNAGWGGAGRDQDCMNWNAFYSCLDGFSPAASVLREDELLIPWVHVWLGGRYLSHVTRGRKLPEPWVMSEMACHMMLRGAETFAVWMDQPGELPADYPFPDYAAMGQFVYDVKGVQEGFNEMLPFHSFLRRARPVTFSVPSARNELGSQTATWSASATPEKTLIRTVSFNHGQPVTKTVTLYDRSVPLEFGARGRCFWVYPDGRVEEVKSSGGEGEQGREMTKHE